MSKLKIAVFFGGKSPEHEVSIITAVQAMASMPNTYETIPIYVDKSGKLFSGDVLKKIGTYQNLQSLEKLAEQVSLPNSPSDIALNPLIQSIFRKSSRPFDVIFPCFHGGVGEGGWIQALAEQYGVPLVGTGLTGAALGMDKVAMKHVMGFAGIKQAPFLWFTRGRLLKEKTELLTLITKTLKYPLFVKPSRGGSSIGTTYAKTKIELTRAIDLAATMDTRIVVEEGITGAREINISIMGNAGQELQASVCEEVLHGESDFLDFKDKYLVGSKSQGMASTDRIIPAKISPVISQQMTHIAKQLFHLFDFAGLVRIDFMVKGKEIYCLEPNTIPGSLSFYIWNKSGYPYPELLDHLIRLAMGKHEESKKTLTDYLSPILTHMITGGKLGHTLGQ